MKLPFVVWIWKRGKPKDGQPGEPPLKKVEVVVYPISTLPPSFTFFFPITHRTDSTYSYFTIDFSKAPVMPNTSDLTLISSLLQTIYNTFKTGRVGIRAAEGKLVSQSLFYTAGSHFASFLLGLIFGRRICVKK